MRNVVDVRSEPMPPCRKHICTEDPDRGAVTEVTPLDLVDEWVHKVSRHRVHVGVGEAAQTKFIVHGRSRNLAAVRAMSKTSV